MAGQKQSRGGASASSRGRGNQDPGQAARAGAAAKAGPVTARSGAGAKNGAMNARSGSAAKGGGPAKAGGPTKTGGPTGAGAAAGRPPAGATPPGGAPVWLQVTTFALSLAGLGISIYLTIAHFTSKAILACPDTGFINCGKVTTSPESEIFGHIPVALLGLAFYVFMVAVNSPWGWRSKLPAVYWARLGSVIVGMVFVLYLLYVELIEISNICLWCSAVHLVTFLLFVVLVFHASSRTATQVARS
jgi:uncharacterized membrane protein